MRPDIAAQPACRAGTEGRDFQRLFGDRTECGILNAELASRAVIRNADGADAGKGHTPDFPGGGANTSGH